LPTDQVAVNPKLGPVGDYAGPFAGNPVTGSVLWTDALLSGSPAVGNAVAADCPATDERGVARSSTQGKCDIGAFQTAPAALSSTSSAPASAVSGTVFADAITVTNGGSGPSSHTTVTETAPAGEDLYAASTSQGTCSVSGQTASCALGDLANGASATVTLTLSSTQTVTNTANASNDQGSAVSSSATTTVASSSSKPPPKKVTGSLQLVGSKLKLTGGKSPHVTITFRCASNSACNGLFSVTIHVKTKNGKTATAVCTKSQFATYQIGAGKTVTLNRAVHGSCVTAVRAHGGHLAGKVTSRPRTGQTGLVKVVSLFL